MLVGTNGFGVFMPGGAARSFTNATLPTATAGACLYPYWDDLQITTASGGANAGIYYRTDGVAPNRIFSVEWFNAGHFGAVANQTITFKIRLFETSNRIQFQYLDVSFGGSQAALDNGASATVGLEGPVATPRPFTLHSFNTASLTAGQCIEFTIPPPCTPVPSGPLTIPASAGQCSANATINIPTFNPAGCAGGTTGIGLRYRLNGGAPVNVPLPGTTVVIPNIPLGVNTITWETYNLATGAVQGSANQTVTVIDTQAPTITCPGNIMVNLDPGACSAFVNYSVTAVDNCFFAGPSGQVNTINTGGNGNAVNGMVWFNINNLTSQPITVTGLGMNISNATLVNIYTKTGTHVGFETNPGAWTLAQTVNANMGPFSGPFPGNGTITPVTTSFVVNPGINGIALGMPSASSNYTNGNGGNQTYTDGTITLNLGSTANTPFGAPFTPRVFNGFVKYQTLVSMGTPTQTSGLPTGANFPIGTTTNCFTIVDNAGNTGTCCFDVIVNEYPNPTATLACNDNVQVSVDTNCTAFVSTDMILEGGPYHCYDDYLVTIQNFGSGTGGV